MTSRKITEGSLGRGPLLKILNKQARVADLSDAGRERLEAALKAGIAVEARKHDLQYGLSDKHIDALKQFPTSEKYADRRLLKPKELKVLENSLDIFFKTKPAESKIEDKNAPLSKTEAPANDNVWSKTEARLPENIEPKPSEAPPRPAANDDRYQEAA
ncbi:hypothetical protein A2118_01330 [Candidatus Kaiserbacteria bacterium GWA2_50_9]|uniref:Uncharacterized protein n=1 Tax=Candidatus Kaiserbacteria bacterium GWA2_50_9 TaxID=1798474 RepID=A0A1F6BTQ2_9BACT|nr:MAG: hypothetical protein A2118_01330 [Candidatus Kaiserbacteria bacterium GWA2_50_9]